MVREHHRLEQPGTSMAAVWVIPVLAALVVVVVLVIFGAVWVGNQVAGVAGPGNPIEMLRQVVAGKFVWPPAAVWFLILEIGLLIAAAGGVFVLVRRMLTGGRNNSGGENVRHPIDARAKFMAYGRETAEYTSMEQMTEKARAMKTVDASTGRTWYGLRMGTQLPDGRGFFMDLEAVFAMIAGPRAGKTSCLVIPAILTAPGAVIATTNKDAKNDLYFATKDVRALVGRVWAFDPQRVVQAAAAFAWNPLTYIVPAKTNPARFVEALKDAETKAAKLAACFASGSRAGNAKEDAFFDPEGETLVTGLLLAAALDGRPVTDVFMWTTAAHVSAAVEVLEEHGFTEQARNVAAADAYPADQRGGVFATAKKMVGSLASRPVHPWILPDAGRDEFDPHTFVRSTDTLYLLAREGGGTCAPLVTALTMAVCEAAEEYAREQGGRLLSPLLAVLDEAANVCLWRDLPALYSHYGSRGILIMTFLQSWSQGVEVWGERGMDKLWSAANIKLAGRNLAVTSDGFLERLSVEVGDHDVHNVTVSSSTTGTSRSVSRGRERILAPGDLAAIPKWRAVLVSSGSRPTWLKLVPHWQQPDLQTHVDELRHPVTEQAAA